MDIRPLTRRNKAGTLYYRDALVEQQIQSMSSLPGEEIIAHAQIQDSDNPQHIHAETMVYWIREYLHRGDQVQAGELANILLARSVKLLQLNLRKLGPDLAPQAEQDVISDLFKDIADLESDRADFLQVRFWLALERRIANAFTRYLRDIRRTKSLPSWKGYELDSDNDVDEDTEPPDPTTTEQLIEDRELLKSALATIDESYRIALVLRHEGWPIESKDPGVLTLSSYFKKDPRSIQNWLRRAEQALREWKEKEQS